MANSIVDKYQNLPGVKVEYEDGNLYSNQQNLQANTQSVLIIGSAVDGPVGEPVSVQAIGGPKAAEKLFGGMLKKEEIETGEIDPNTGQKIKKTVKVPHQGNLIRKMYEVLRAGNEDVRLLRISGRRAKTELHAQNVAAELTQLLGLAKGNVAFSKALSLGQDARINSNAIEYIRELMPDGTTLLREFTGSAVNNVILNVDTTPGSETIHFAADKFRPGNKLEVKVNYSKRNYHEVTRSDADGVLTQDPTKTNYFSGTHGFWSDNVQAGHTINVYVNGIGIPQMNANGQYLWRPGKEDADVTNELTQDYTAKEFEQGGIRFTSAYQQEVQNGVYPALTAAVTVAADYFYYDETPMNHVEVVDVPGSDTTYELNYTPQADAFRVYYELNGNQYDLTLKDAQNPNGDFTMVFPAQGSKEKVKVVVKAGAAPVGVKLYAVYKTSESSVDNPMLIVEGKYPGTIYGGIKNVYDPATLYGVQVEVREDITPEDPSGYEKIIAFIKPEDKRFTNRDYAIEYRTRELKGVRTLREFVNFVNNDPRNNVVQLSVPFEAGEIPVQGLLPTDRPVFLGEYKNPATGEYELLKDETKPVTHPDYYPWLGTDGFFDVTDLKSMKELYEELGGVYELVPGTLDEYELVKQGIYNKLENYAVDVIIMTEAYANTPIGREVKNEVTGQIEIVEDPTRNFATQLAQHCAIVTAKTWETIGVINVAPVKNATLLDIQAYIDELTAPGMNEHYMYNEATGELILNDEGEPMDIGRYVNVVYGPEVGLANDKIGTYVSDGAAVYAGLITTLNPEVSTTNKAVPVQGLRYHLSEAQHNQLAGARYVTFEEKINLNGTRRVVVKDGVTAALPTSDYQRLSTVRIVHATVQLVRRKADPFIGMPNGLAQRNSLATEIQAGLDRLKELGVLQDFRFSIFTSAKERVLGNAFITLELVPQFETRKIFTSVSLRASL
jgi:hypothetical protein